jgi:hypothetical protein
VRGAALGVLVGFGVYFALIVIGAVGVTSGTGTVDSRATAWELVSFVAGLVAGFLAARAAARAPRPVRLVAALAGPSVIALVFALTTTARDESALWIAFGASVIGAAAGAAARETAAG